MTLKISEQDEQILSEASEMDMVAGPDSDNQFSVENATFSSASLAESKPSVIRPLVPREVIQEDTEPKKPFDIFAHTAKVRQNLGAGGGEGSSVTNVQQENPGPESVVTIDDFYNRVRDAAGKRIYGENPTVRTDIKPDGRRPRSFYPETGKGSRASDIAGTSKGRSK